MTEEQVMRDLKGLVKDYMLSRDIKWLGFYFDATTGARGEDASARPDIAELEFGMMDQPAEHTVG